MTERTPDFQRHTADLFKETLPHESKKSYTRMFIKSFEIIAKIRKQLTCPSLGERVGRSVLPVLFLMK